MLLTEFAASRKEPLATVLERIHNACIESGLGETALHFSFSDSPIPGFLSSVDRVLKRFPDLARFSSVAVLPGGMSAKTIANNGAAFPFATILAIAAGVPRSFPFHNLTIQFQLGETSVITVTDSWWVNGRSRSVMATNLVDADPSSKKLPPFPEPIAKVVAACGKARRTVQAPVIAPIPEGQTAPDPAVAEAVRNVVREYREKMAEIVDRAAQPHDLPGFAEARAATPLGTTPGPKKPVLVELFKPMGYDCHGGTGEFTLRRRTAKNLTVELCLDVGTWSNSFLGSYRVRGLGFNATLPLAISKRAPELGQYPIGDAAQWRKIVENIAALTAEFDRSFVPAVEAVAGASPEWYRPES